MTKDIDRDNEYDMPPSVLIGGVEYAAPEGYVLLFKKNTLFVTPAIEEGAPIKRLYQVEWETPGEEPTFIASMEKRRLVPVERK